MLVKLAMQSTCVKGNKASVRVVKAEGEFLPSCASLRKNTLEPSLCLASVMDWSELRTTGLLLRLPECSGD